MKIGIIGPSKLQEKHKELIDKLAGVISKKGYEIVVTPDKGSSSEYFSQKYLGLGGKKVFSVIPLDDKEFGYEWVNAELGEQINCGTWRNQPEKLNEKTEALLCIGHSVGGMMEIGYTKWFGRKSKISTLSSKNVEQKPKPVYIIKEITEEKFPSQIEKELDIRYVSLKDFERQI